MYYYLLSIIGSPLGEFSYHFSKNITIGTKVKLIFNNHEKEGVVTSISEEPLFKTNEILEITEFYYTNKQMKLAQFISSYYFSSLGEALSLIMPYDNTTISASSNFLHDNSIQLSQKQENALEFLQKQRVSYFSEIQEVERQKYI